MYQNNVFINHDTDNTTGGTIREPGGCQSQIQGNIFLGSSMPSDDPGRLCGNDSQTIKTYESGIIFVDNLFGLKMDDLGGLDTGWGEWGNWNSLSAKLSELETRLELPPDMGKFFCLLNTGGYNEGHPIVFRGKIVNASAET